MIYRQIGLNTGKLKLIKHNFNTPLEALANTPFDVVSENEDLEKYKSDKSFQFLSGDVKPNKNGSYTRNDSNLNSRDLIVIDIEKTGLTSQEVEDIIQDKLASYKYVLYSTISHKPNNPRLRLALEPNRIILQDEYKPTIQHVMALVGVNYDTKSYAWSQPQGLPIAVEGKETVSIKHLDGLPYPVQEAVKKEQKVITTYSNEPVKKILHDEAISIMEKYIENEPDKLQERNEYYLSCLTVIAKSVVTGEIEYDTAIECMELLALNNDEWKENNIKELNGEITRANGSIEYFKNNYTFKSKFERTQQGVHITHAVTKKNLRISTNEHGKVFQTLENLEKIILSITPIAYNELTNVIEIEDKQGKIKPLEKRDKELLRVEIEKRFKFKAKLIDLDTAIVSASDRYRYHPIKNKILDTKWDGIPRAESFFIDVLGVEDNVYNRECTRKWLLASLTRLFKNGVKFDEMIILQGGQGIGKSTTLQRLSLGYYTDITDKLSDETTFKVMRTWLVELSELSTMKKTDSDTFKAWLSATKDTVRKKYGGDPDDYPRAFTILGTTNNKEILKDRTGNRRYWLMYCEKENIKNTIWSLDNNYILQLWSEVYQWYKNGENLLISDETKLHMEKLSSGALEHNPLEERVNSILEMKVPNNWHDYFIDGNSRFKYYHHVNDYVSFGKGDSKFPQQIQIMDITTNELHYLLSDNSTNFHADMRGNKLAKEINQVMNNLPNWKKSESIKRSYSKRGLKGFVRKPK